MSIRDNLDAARQQVLNAEQGRVTAVLQTLVRDNRRGRDDPRRRARSTLFICLDWQAGSHVGFSESLFFQAAGFHFMTKELHQICLGLGSNLDNRADYLRRALEGLAGAGIQFDRISPIYETEPVDVKNQPWFLNQAATAKTNLTPFELLDFCLDLEYRLGRQRTNERGPRFIDIDILLYDNLVIKHPALTIPHPRFHSRRFVLVPLAELAPDLVHPVLNLSIRTLLDHCADVASVVLFE